MDEYEQWLPWPEDNKYLISNLGRVKGKTGKILRPILDENRGGYYFVNMDKPHTTNVRTKKPIHRLIMETFAPIQNPSQYVVDHINGIKTDNRLENLRWVSSEENTRLGSQNRKKINDKINQLIQKYGYEKTEELILNIE